MTVANIKKWGLIGFGAFRFTLPVSLQHKPTRRKRPFFLAPGPWPLAPALVETVKQV